GSTKLAGESFKSEGDGKPVIDNNGNKVHNVATGLAFRDAKKIGVWADESIKELNLAGVINGYDKDNTFRPENNITRAEMMTMITKAKANLK
ncbi:MAG: S-layer homology domain-containing protein, partial [Romboutsia sp.]